MFVYLIQHIRMCFMRMQELLKESFQVFPSFSLFRCIEFFAQWIIFSTIIESNKIFPLLFILLLGYCCIQRLLFLPRKKWLLHCWRKIAKEIMKIMFCNKTNFDKDRTRIQILIMRPRYFVFYGKWMSLCCENVKRKYSSS